MNSNHILFNYSGVSKINNHNTKCFHYFYLIYLINIFSISVFSVLSLMIHHWSSLIFVIWFILIDVCLILCQVLFLLIQFVIHQKVFWYFAIAINGINVYAIRIMIIIIIDYNYTMSMHIKFLMNRIMSTLIFVCL